MNDNDIDTLLRDHGTSWRDANHDRPGIDWDEVTKPRRTRTWLAVAGAAVAAAAVVVPLLVTAGGTPSATQTTTPPRPSGTNGPGPAEFFAIRNGALVVKSALALEAQRESGQPIRALGVGPDGRTAFTAIDVPHCNTEIVPHRTVDAGEFGGVPAGYSDVTFPGRVAAEAMSVNPDATRLALVETPCGGTGETIAIVDLVNGALWATWPAGPSTDRISSLHWAPDGRHLAYLMAPRCAYLSYSTSVCPLSDGATRILDTLAAGQPLTTYPAVLPFLGDRKPTTYGPVFWWHGQLVTAFEGALFALNGNGGIGKVVASGLATHGSIDSVSSDPTGDHLLLTNLGKTYRWDNGVLSVVKGQWTQPGW